MKFITHLIGMDLTADTATFHLPAGTRLGAGTYSVELLTAGQPANRRCSEKVQAVQELRTLLDLVIGAAVLEGGVSQENIPQARANTEARVADLMAAITGALAWQPQFDVMSPKQEALAMQFVIEIAGPKDEAGSPPDPVRLLEMAQALYDAEREECGP